MLDSDAGGRLRSTRPGYLLFLLMTGYLLSFLDRQILVMMIDPIKRDFGLSDTDFSLLYGFAFATFYTVLGLAFGRLIDSANRTRVLALCVALWSLATIFCGLATNFPQLFVARMLVGVGEAALAPAAYSLIADVYPAGRRGRAFAIYTMGMYLGAGLAFAMGGSLVQMFAHLETLSWAGLTIKSWQIAFFIAGLPGLVVAFALLFCREPARGTMAGDAALAGPRASFGAFVRQYRAHGQLYFTHHLGFGLHICFGYAITAWLPVTFMRVHQMPPAVAGLAFGVAIMIMGPLGAWLGGVLAEARERRGSRESQLSTTAYACLAQLVAITGATMLSHPWAAFACGTVAIALVGFPAGLNAAALQLITPPTLRGQAGGFFILIGNLLGLGLGPLVVALLTDRLFARPDAVGNSLWLVGLVVLPAAAITLLRGSVLFARRDEMTAGTTETSSASAALAADSG
ncbi:spinster family MFS transporter [Sphingobium jiangsuense]|nr:MFS transporter [Sphingobium jiangsuense]